MLYSVDWWVVTAVSRQLVVQAVQVCWTLDGVTDVVPSCVTPQKSEDVKKTTLYRTINSDTLPGAFLCILFGIILKNTEAADNCVMVGFLICTPRQILLGWSKEDWIGGACST
jgi:hypothetical protein